MGGPRAAAVFLALVLAATSRGGATSRGSSSDEPPAAATCSFAAHDWNAAHTATGQCHARSDSSLQLLLVVRSVSDSECPVLTASG